MSLKETGTELAKLVIRSTPLYQRVTICSSRQPVPAHSQQHFLWGKGMGGGGGSWWDLGECHLEIVLPTSLPNLLK